MIFNRNNVLVLLFIGVVSSQSYDDSEYQQQQQQQVKGDARPRYEQQQQQEAEGSQGNAVDASVPEPPSQIPETSFVCEGKPYDPGMYADQETGCRVYHMCYRGRKESFICGTGTIFNQEILSCDYPTNVDCNASPDFYASNSELGKSAPEPSGNQRPEVRPGGQRPRPQQPVVRPRPPPQPRDPDYRPGGSDENPTFDGEKGRPVQRPEPPVKRPVPRPVAPRPTPRPAPRPTPPPYRPPQVVNPGKVRPSQPKPRPVIEKPRPRPPPREPQRPIVQTQDEDQGLDYEPSVVIQQRQRSPVQNHRRQAAYFRPQSRQWQLMSDQY